MTFPKATLSAAFLLPLLFTTAISLSNRTTNSQTATSLSAYQDPAEAVRTGTPIPDTKLQALATFTARMLEIRGMITKSDAAAFLDAGFSQQQIMEIILAISVKTLSNYSNHIFHTDLDEVFAPYRV